MARIQSPVNGRSASVLSRSTLPPSSSATSSSSSSSSNQHNRAASQPGRFRSASGSETERETYHPDEYEHEPERAASPPESISQRQIRQRLTSAPESPSKFRTREIERHLASPTRQPRKRASMMNQRVEFAEDERQDDVSSAALAAVASLRQSPTGRKNRQPLPQEFRENDQRSVSRSESRSGLVSMFVLLRQIALLSPFLVFGRPKPERHNCRAAKNKNSITHHKRFCVQFSDDHTTLSTSGSHHSTIFNPARLSTDKIYEKHFGRHLYICA